MAKYAKYDCRNNAKILKTQEAYSRMRWLRESIFTGENRHKRRAIGARFRSVYGKDAFYEMKENAKKKGILEAVLAYVEGDKDAYETITGRKLKERKHD